jgi:hypothetical protein
MLRTHLRIPLIFCGKIILIPVGAEVALERWRRENGGGADIEIDWLTHDRDLLGSLLLLLLLFFLLFVSLLSAIRQLGLFTATSISLPRLPWL